jgi:hypothetical protein
MSKRWLLLEEATKDSRCPFKNARQIHNLKFRSTPKVDSRGNVVHPGDPEFLALFSRPVSGTKSMLFLDMEGLDALMEKRRENRTEAAKCLATRDRRNG